MQTILSKFLNAGLLPIGEDDEKLKLLEAAATDLADQIRSTPLLLQRFMLVAWDDTIPATDPVHAMVGSAIVNKWQTITNKIGPNPTQVFRAVILRAVELVATDHAIFSQAAVLTVENQVPPTSPRTKEGEVIEQMLARFNDTAAQSMIDAWVKPIDISLPKLGGRIKKPDKHELLLGLTSAAGPTDKQGRSVEDANPHWPNAGSPWSHEFAGRAADAIHAAIYGASKVFADDLQEGMRGTIQSLVDAVGKSAVRDAKAELLWIRTSLYSPSAGKAYRDLSPHELVFYAALDISRAVTKMAPPSVEFFLRELISGLSNSTLRLSAVLREIEPTLSTTSEGKAVLAGSLPAVGRRGILDVALRGNPKESFQQQAGYPETREETPADIAVKLYRDLQIRKLLSTLA